MSTACALAPPTVVADAWAEMVASLANMVESALTGDGLTGAGTAGCPAGVGEDAVEVGTDDPGRVEGDRGASGPSGDRLRSPVDADAGPRAHRVDDAPVRPGHAGGPARLGGQRHRGDRLRSGPLRSQRHAPRRVQGAGRPGVSGRGRGGVRSRGLPAGPLQRRPGPPAGTGPPDRHPGDRQRRRL
jgi:hypothetical protein